MNMINWDQLISQIKIESVKAQLERFRADAYRGIQAWENWVIYYGCLEQANNGDNEGGCEKCNLEDWGIDWCPWHPDAMKDVN